MARPARLADRDPRRGRRRTRRGLDGECAPVLVSLSHRGGRALAAGASTPAVVGCDLELVEPRSGAFVREWLAPAEQRLLQRARRTSATDRNLVWTAKEAAAKVRREGLRLEVRRAAVDVRDVSARPAAWRPLTVDWGGAGRGPPAGGATSRAGRRRSWAPPRRTRPSCSR